MRAFIKKNLPHIMFIVLFAVFATCVRANVPVDTNNVEHVIWHKAPIEMTLPIGKERMISFPTQVRVQLADSENALTTNDITLLNNDGTLYITAKRKFPKTRLYVKTIVGADDKTGSVQYGEMLLVDIKPVASGDDALIAVVEKDNQNPAQENSASDVADKIAKANGTDSLGEAVSLVSLNRFAIQSLYAPKRLIKTPSGIYRVPMHTDKTVHLVANDNVIAMPLASWRDNNLTVTAVLLRNMNNTAVNLSPDLILGQWASSVFYPREHLSSHGTKDDSTTVFLTSSNDFNSALGGV